MMTGPVKIECVGGVGGIQRERENCMSTKCDACVSSTIFSSRKFDEEWIDEVRG